VVELAPLDPALRSINPDLGHQRPPSALQAMRTTIITSEGIAMLILTRRTEESIMIGTTIKLIVLGVKGNQVRIGIEAPRDVAVHREEIYERIRREIEADSEGVNGNVA